MRRFRRVFALLFVLSVLVGVAHEMSHAHHSGDVCEVCLLAHSPALVEDTPAIALIDRYFEPFAAPHIAYPAALPVPGRSRSPPLS